MKLLVAYGPPGGQGTEFNWTDGPEWLIPASPCCNSTRCGCDRSFVGLASRKGATRARVEDVDTTPAEFRAAVRASERRAWGEHADDDAGLAARVEPMLRAAEHFPLGAIVRRQGATLYEGTGQRPRKTR